MPRKKKTGYQPGDEQRFDRVEPATCRKWAEALHKLGRFYFRIETSGMRNIPRRGGALIVANHGYLGLDAPFFQAEVFLETGRIPRALVEHLVWKLPFFREAVLKTGGVAGTQRNAVRLLKQGELAVVYPCGAKGGVKDWRRRYRLQWRDRYGFIKVALKAQVPIVPAVTVGADDTYLSVRDGYEVGGKLFGGKRIPMPLFVGLGPLPFPVKFSVTVGRPIRLEHPPTAVRSKKVVEACQKMVWGQLQEMLDRGLEKRARSKARPKRKR